MATIFNIKTAAETEALGVRFGACLRGGEVIELISDLGGGKTTFVRGLVRGIGSTDHVASPTFTISREYSADDRTLYHFDFYRLSEAGLMADELGTALDNEKGVVVVEWSDVVKRVLPDKRLVIAITATADDERRISIDHLDKYPYIRAELTS